MAYHFLDFLKAEDWGEVVNIWFANLNSSILKEHNVKFGKDKERYLKEFQDMVCLRYGEREWHLALLVNPISGKWKAIQYVENHAVPFFNLVGLKHTVIRTESTEFIYNWIESFKSFDEIPYTDFVLCSGDGTMNHFINAIYKHPYRQRIIDNIPIGLIPGGSACGVPKSLGGTTINWGVINQIRGKTLQADVMRINFIK